VLLDLGVERITVLGASRCSRIVHRLCTALPDPPARRGDVDIAVAGLEDAAFLAQRIAVFTTPIEAKLTSFNTGAPLPGCRDLIQKVLHGGPYGCFPSARPWQLCNIPDKNVHRVFSRGGFGFASCYGCSRSFFCRSKYTLL
jgi:hypothetical protein